MEITNNEKLKKGDFVIYKTFIDEDGLKATIIDSIYSEDSEIQKILIRKERKDSNSTFKYYKISSIVKSEKGFFFVTVSSNK